MKKSELLAQMPVPHFSLRLVAYTVLDGQRFYLADSAHLTPNVEFVSTFESYDKIIFRIVKMQSFVNHPFTICNYENL